MTQTLQFELVSPEEKLVCQPVSMVTIPGDEGEFGVKPRHASLVASLRAGVVTLHNAEDEDKRSIFIAGGFADVTGESCTILAEEAVNVNDLDHAALEQQLSDLNEDLGLAEEELDKKRILRKITLVKSKIEAVKLAA